MPVTPFPPIGDAAYRQRVGERPSRGHRQHAKNLVKIARVIPEIFPRTERQTDSQTDMSQYFETVPRGLSKKTLKLETVSIAEPLQNRQHAQNP